MLDTKTVQIAWNLHGDLYPAICGISEVAGGGEFRFRNRLVLQMSDFLRIGELGAGFVSPGIGDWQFPAAADRTTSTQARDRGTP